VSEPAQAYIEIRGFTYRYPPTHDGASPVTALDGISLSLPAGAFLGVTGTSGSGKSTLCLALNGLVPRVTGGSLRGEVRIGGWSTKQTAVARMATRAGLVFQDPESNLVGLTVEDEVAFGCENLGVPPAEIAERIDWALATVGLSAERTRGSAQLSGGQKQRLAIAAALAMRPALLVLDEPTAQLDPAGKYDVANAVEELRRQAAGAMTIVMVEQDAELLARFAERVIVLDAGRIILDGSPMEVLGQVERLAALGIDVSQPAEIAARLNPSLGTRLQFLTSSEAEEPLAELLREGVNSRLSCSPAGSRHPERSPARSQTVRPSAQDDEGGAGQAVRGVRDTAQDDGARALLKTRHDSFAGEGVPLLSVENITYEYEGGVLALRGVDLRLEPGELVALIGVNGSGKTTLAKHLNGLLRPAGGRVLLDGLDTREHETGELARLAGYAFQNPDHQIFQATVEAEIGFGPANLGLGGRELEERVAETLATFGLSELRREHPMLLGRGPRRRVALAAVYAMHPRLLILDEPTSGLDRANSERLLATLNDYVTAGGSIIFITHDLRLAAACRRVVIMREGRVLADGATSDLLTDAALLHEAGLRPPAVVELSTRLQPLGMGPALTVAEFEFSFLACLSRRSNDQTREAPRWTSAV